LGSGFRFRRDSPISAPVSVPKIPKMPVVVALTTKRSGAFGRVQLTKDFPLFSRTPKVSRQLHAAWTQHEIGNIMRPELESYRFSDILQRSRSKLLSR
jgi:hypothetical protein